MRTRMKNPVYLVPNVLQPLLAVASAAKEGALPRTTLYFIYLRVSQINGCAWCIDMHARELAGAGVGYDRILAVSAFRESPHFDAPERAALALAEALTRCSDASDAVPDVLWEEVSRHYDEAARASLVLNISLINFWNRTNLATRQVPAAAAT